MDCFLWQEELAQHSNSEIDCLTNLKSYKEPYKKKSKRKNPKRKIKSPSIKLKEVDFIDERNLSVDYSTKANSNCWDSNHHVLHLKSNFGVVQTTQSQKQNKQKDDFDSNEEELEYKLKENTQHWRESIGLIEIIDDFWEESRHQTKKHHFILKNIILPDENNIGSWRTIFDPLSNSKESTPKRILDFITSSRPFETLEVFNSY